MEVVASVWIWSSDKGSWHFITVPPDVSDEIRAQAIARRASFGSVPVQVCTRGIQWRTSLFPDRLSGGYLLPIKADVRRRAGIAADDVVQVDLSLL